MQLDKDLISIQETRDLLIKAHTAQQKFKEFTQEQVDKIVRAMFEAGYSASEKLAKMAYEETGFGKWQDKVLKNQFSTKNVYESIKNLKTVGVISVEQNGKIIKIAEPMGVVAALIPSTNPTSTTMFKAIISVKGRNGMVASPHPRAVKCSKEALDVVATAAYNAGAPEGLLNCITNPTLQGTEELMRHNLTAVILATGSNPMVKAAYSAGTPAYGVGSGNVPAYIDRSANISKAVLDIVAGTTFDNGTLCSSEQAMVVDFAVKDDVIREGEKAGIYFVSEEEKEKLEKTVTKGGKINADIVGKNAQWIANYAGIKVPDSTKVIAAFCSKVGKDEPLSMEKLSPMLAFYSVEGWKEGCHRCIELLNFGGVGHTLSIHAQDKDVIMKFALEKPAFRIVVNSLSSLGAVGFTTAMTPSMTLGVGTWGGSIISENVSAKHLINIKTLAFETNPINQGNSLKEMGLLTTDDAESFTAQIEKRLLARAGNPPFSSYGKLKDNSESDNTEKPINSGISKEQINRIIENFRKNN